MTYLSEAWTPEMQYREFEVRSEPLVRPPNPKVKFLTAKQLWTVNRHYITVERLIRNDWARHYFNRFPTSFEFDSDRGVYWFNPNNPYLRGLAETVNHGR